MKHGIRIRAYDSAEEFQVEPGTYLYHDLGEDRTDIGKAIEGARSLARDGWGVALLEDPGAVGGVVRLPLREPRRLIPIWEALPEPVYLDITGMPHEIWAALIRVAFDTQRLPRVVYMQPEHYRRDPSPSSASRIFDLISNVDGVAPLPGFARIAIEDERESIFVPILGFEGIRVLHIAEDLSLTRDRTIPIVPAPGFRMEYPALTYACNRQLIQESRSWGHIRYAPAANPFVVYEHLTEVLHDHPGANLRVSLTGTKPHALGAIIFSLAHPHDVELIFDRPIERRPRATGVTRVLVFQLDEFLP